MPTREQLLILVTIALLRHPDAAYRSSELAELIMNDDMRPEWQALGIAQALVDRALLPMNVGLTLQQHVHNTAPNQRVVVSHPGATWSYGPCAFQKLQGFHADFPRDPGSQARGLVGELAVAAELVARGWNAGKLPLDDGIDVVATSGTELRTIQVKTSWPSDAVSDKFSFTIKRASHERYVGLRHFYAFVMRRYLVRRWVNDILLIRSTDLESWGVLDHDATGTNWFVRLELRNGECLLMPVNRDVTEHVNSFRALGNA